VGGAGNEFKLATLYTVTRHDHVANYTNVYGGLCGNSEAADSIMRYGVAFLRRKHETV
jgi:hypothetical protein